MQQYTEIYHYLNKITVNITITHIVITLLLFIAQPYYARINIKPHPSAPISLLGI